MKKQKKLPKKASTLIRRALKDMSKVFQMRKKYTVDMGNWHGPVTVDNGSTRCAVCFGGSVMARSLGADPNKEVSPTKFNKFNRTRLFALNEFRTGNVSQALHYMNIPREKMDKAREKGLKEHVRVAYYRLGRGPRLTRFKKSMREIANHLESVGL